MRERIGIPTITPAQAQSINIKWQASPLSIIGRSSPRRS
jgi:hypothetical protein